MKLIKTILYIENETSNLTLDTLEALQIIDAVSDYFSICGKAADSILKIKEVELRLQENKADVKTRNGLGILDDFKLDDNILIVTIGNHLELKTYLANRINNRVSDYKWHIINSTYARIGYLDRKRNLSDFIPFDTLRWLKE